LQRNNRVEILIRLEEVAETTREKGERWVVEPKNGSPRKRQVRLH